MKGKGFTLVEVILVVAIISVLAVIAIPNIVRSRQVTAKNACIANLKQIQSAIQIWAMDQNKNDTDAVVRDTAGTTIGIVPDYMKSWPKCSNVTYSTPAAVSSVPTCPNSGGYTDHVIP